MRLKLAAVASLILVAAMTGCRNDGAAVDAMPSSSPENSGTVSPPDVAPDSDPVMQPEVSEPGEPSEVSSPSSPSRVAATAASGDAPLEQMALARASGKIGAPVDVRYLVSGVVAKDQPATVQLAFVPRVAGSNLQVQFPATAGVTIETGAQDLQMQKAAPTDVVRHRLLVTPTAGDAGEMRAIVSMELGGARFFTIYTIPIGTSDKTQSKQPPKG
jgi:hypothetical protein